MMHLLQVPLIYLHCAQPLASNESKLRSASANVTDPLTVCSHQRRIVSVMQ
jgi:hypothetical protein